jgi:hypothetical protein
MKPRFEIEGRAGAEEAGAVAAVIAALVEEEAAAKALPPRAPRQSSWVLAWRPRDVPAPLPSHNFDARPWAEIESDHTESDTEPK